MIVIFSSPSSTPTGASRPVPGEISYIDVGTGPVALFQHGVATNASLWRNVIGALSGQRPGHRRCSTPDLRYTDTAR